MAQEAHPLPLASMVSAASASSAILVPGDRPVAEALSTLPGTLPSPPVQPAGHAGNPTELVAPSVRLGARVAGSTRRASSDRPLQVHLFVLDVLAVTACWVGMSLQFDRAPTVLDAIGPGCAASVVMLLAMRTLQLYRSRRCVRRVDELWRVGVASLWGGAAFVLMQSQLVHPGAQVVLCAAASAAVVGACRWEFGRVLRAQRALGRRLRGVVLVGANEDALALRTMLRSEPELGYAVAAVVGEGAGDQAWTDLPSSESVTDIPRLAAATGASGILVVPFGQSGGTIRAAIGVATGSRLHVQVWPGIQGVGSRRLRSVPLSGEPFFYVEPSTAAAWQWAAKRVIDVVGAAVLLVLTAPVLAVAAVLIKLEDGGPVFHRGERVGMHGQPFEALKLRSMVSDGAGDPGDPGGAPDLRVLNERTDGPLFKASHDPRVTKIGRLLRSTSVDELPQLWNVLTGTMSLVGPRPALPSEVAEFDDELQRRHSVRPGMTGMWQVEARRNPSFNAYRRLDLRYVDNWSLWLDAVILCGTVPAVLSQAVAELRRRGRR